MIFKRKFFLDLSGSSEEQPAAPAKVAPVREAASAKPAAKTPAAQPAASQQIGRAHV